LQFAEEGDEIDENDVDEVVEEVILTSEDEEGSTNGEPPLNSEENSHLLGSSCDDPSDHEDAVSLCSNYSDLCAQVAEVEPVVLPRRTTNQPTRSRTKSRSPSSSFRRTDRYNKSNQNTIRSRPRERSRSLERKKFNRSRSPRPFGNRGRHSRNSSPKRGNNGRSWSPRRKDGPRSPRRFNARDSSPKSRQFRSKSPRRGPRSRSRSLKRRNAENRSKSPLKSTDRAAKKGGKSEDKPKPKSQFSESVKKIVQDSLKNSDPKEKLKLHKRKEKFSDSNNSELVVNADKKIRLSKDITSKHVENPPVAEKEDLRLTLKRKRMAADSTSEVKTAESVSSSSTELHGNNNSNVSSSMPSSSSLEDRKNRKTSSSSKSGRMKVKSEAYVPKRKVSIIKN